MKMSKLFFAGLLLSSSLANAASISEEDALRIATSEAAKILKVNASQMEVFSEPTVETFRFTFVVDANEEVECGVTIIVRKDTGSVRRSVLECVER
jgi:alkyl hydroperoxide reductase subunit AhpC